MKSDNRAGPEGTSSVLTFFSGNGLPSSTDENINVWVAVTN